MSRKADGDLQVDDHDLRGLERELRKIRWNLETIELKVRHCDQGIDRLIMLQVIPAVVSTAVVLSILFGFCLWMFS